MTTIPFSPVALYSKFDIGGANILIFKDFLAIFMYLLFQEHFKIYFNEFWKTHEIFIPIVLNL